MENHSHDWAFVIYKGQGQRWHFRHALIHCLCGAFSVTEYSEDPTKRGPCNHSVGVWEGDPEILEVPAGGWQDDEALAYAKAQEEPTPPPPKMSLEELEEKFGVMVWPAKDSAIGDDFRPLKPFEEISGMAVLHKRTGELTGRIKESAGVPEEELLG